jgi:hypothetical protein
VTNFATEFIEFKDKGKKPLSFLSSIDSVNTNIGDSRFQKNNQNQNSNGGFQAMKKKKNLK